MIQPIETLPERLKTAIGSTPIHIIAAKSGLSPVTFSRILNGHVVPTQSRVIKAIEKILKNG